MDLSIIIATINEAENISALVPRLLSLFAEAQAEVEILVIDGPSTDDTLRVARALGCRGQRQTSSGYAQAIRDGIALACGDYVIIMDADLSHDPRDALRLFQNRLRADIVINSRYVEGGGTQVDLWRDVLSRILNLLYRNVLRLPFREISGGFRIYRRDVLQRIRIESRFYEVQEEILIKAHWLGYGAVEIPYLYRLRAEGRSKVQTLKYGFHLLMALWRLLRQRKRFAGQRSM